jgi:hypothetical protein
MLAGHERAEVPELLGILTGESPHDRLVEFVVTTRSTLPAKPFSDDTVIVDMPVAPTLTGTLVGLADIAKS